MEQKLFLSELNSVLIMNPLDSKNSIFSSGAIDEPDIYARDK